VLHRDSSLTSRIRLPNIILMGVLFTINGDLRYEVVRKIYEGGMGIVYEAEQIGARDFVKRVAIKVIRQNYANQKQFIENFIGEAKLVADLIHTNIVQTYHLGEAKNVFYIAMELIRGANLEQFSDQLQTKQRTLPIDMAVFIVSRVVRGLAYAHAKTDKDGKPLGIVHRDVSFKNVMLAYEGDVKLTDFGIAKARGFLIDNEGEVVAGKADFMSPEQANFQITDRRSDLFSVGVVLAHLLL
jgi:eukaryotic-like serine/threonine-protein kinase